MKYTTKYKKGAESLMTQLLFVVSENYALIFWPPQQRITLPVTQEESSLARKDATDATSEV